MIRVSRSGDPKDAKLIGKEAGEEIKAIAGVKFREYGDAVVEAQAKAAIGNS